MNLFWRSAVCLLLVFTLSACGSTPTAPSVNISGRWQGTFETTGDQPGTITLQLTQTGMNVTGTALLSQNEFPNVPGTVTGTVATGSSATTVQFVLTYEFGAPACQGSFRGTLNATSSQLDGAFNGQNCTRTFAGNLHATKSN
jgi:hypothetical protein